MNSVVAMMTLEWSVARLVLMIAQYLFSMVTNLDLSDVERKGDLISSRSTLAAWPVSDLSVSLPSVVILSLMVSLTLVVMMMTDVGVSSPSSVVAPADVDVGGGWGLLLLV